MASPTPDTLKRHYPATAHDFQIAADGEWLIIKRVPIGDRFYDIRIQRKDENGVVIPVGTENRFHKSTIAKVAKFAQAMYVQGDIWEDLIPKTEMTCGYLHGKELCQIKVGGEDLPLDLSSLDEQKKAIIGAAFQIYNTFFNETALGKTNDKSDFLSPVFEPPSKRIIPQYITQDDGLNADDDFDDDNTDPPISPVAKQPQKKEESLKEVGSPENPKIEETLGKNRLDNFSYDELRKYAQDFEKDPSKRDDRYHKQYELFKRLLENPNDSAAAGVFKWLQDMYKQIYQQFYVDAEDMKAVHAQGTKNRKNRNNSKISYEEWSKDAAARQVVGFIRIKNQSMEPLINKLTSHDVNLSN